MKYIKTTLVDARSGVPVTEAPARNGVILPEGVEQLFTVEGSTAPSSLPWSTPDIYGVVTDESYYEELLSLPHILEIDEESFWEMYKQELIDRAKEKKWQVETSGIDVGGIHVDTTREDQARIHEAYTGRSVIEEGVADFTLPSGVVQLSVPQIEAMFTSIARHVQDCFSWQASMIAQIQSLELNYENHKELVDPVLEAISMFGAPEEAEEDTPLEQGGLN